MYTTNAVESVNSSFRKVTKRGAFPNENALLKLLYLRITELYKKWNDSKVQNWAMVRNQLVTDDKIKARIEKYEHPILTAVFSIDGYPIYAENNLIFNYSKNLHTFLDKACVKMGIYFLCDCECCCQR